MMTNNLKLNLNNKFIQESDNQHKKLDIFNMNLKNPFNLQ